MTGAGTWSSRSQTGTPGGDWFEPHQIERLTLAAAEQYIRVLHEDRVKAAKKRAKPLTYEEGCICPSCVMQRAELEAIAIEAGFGVQRGLCCPLARTASLATTTTGPHGQPAVEERKAASTMDGTYDENSPGQE